MPDLSGLPALDVLLGIAFLYFVLSIVTSTINEVIAARLKLRARDLETGLRQLLGDEETFKRFISSPRIRALHDPKGRLPSYIPPRAFSLALLDTLAPPTAGTSHDVIAHAKDAVEKIQNPAVQTLLNDALKEARGDADHFRLSMERSFDDVMNRVSGWYKRRVQKILFVIGLLLTPSALPWSRRRATSRRTRRARTSRRTPRRRSTTPPSASTRSKSSGSRSGGPTTRRPTSSAGSGSASSPDSC
jgi:hypothetical protein